MTFWQWFRKRFCAHEWETQVVETIKLGNERLPGKIVATVHVFQERCKQCGTNNVKRFRV